MAGKIDAFSCHFQVVRNLPSLPYRFRGPCLSVEDSLVVVIVVVVVVVAAAAAAAALKRAML